MSYRGYYKRVAYNVPLIGGLIADENVALSVLEWHEILYQEFLKSHHGICSVAQTQAVTRGA